jgi:hypothetical protein
MAILSFFGSLPSDLFSGRGRNFDIESENELVLLDLLLDESHEMPTEVTRYKVEDGSDITENIYLPLRSGSITGYVSNLSAQRTTSVFNPFETPTNWAQVEYNALKRLRDEKKPVTIVTNLEIYEDVLITGISVARSEEDGESQAYSISFSESNIVKLQTVAVDVTISVNNMKNNRNRQAANSLNVGRR